MFDQKFQNRNKWYRHFLEKFPEISKKTIQSKILEILEAKSNGMEVTSMKVPESLVYPMPPFPEIASLVRIRVTSKNCEY